MRDCPVCNLPNYHILGENELGVIVRDAFPVFPGHTLIIPKRHVGPFFVISSDERAGLMALL